MECKFSLKKLISWGLKIDLLEYNMHKIKIKFKKMRFNKIFRVIKANNMLKYIGYVLLELKLWE